ncbi:histone H1 [Ricinus communis]|uniref:histone H1 n=1 Tax=Ricinus communis TaxID=3988 RepID=UPI00201A8901|nr:histone H1 [Ricinus communis]
MTLKERTGSSQYAITKFIEEKHNKLTLNFRKLLLFHLKKLTASCKVVKIKNSFKLPFARSAPAKKPATDANPKISTTKVKAATKVAAAKPKAKVAAAKLKPKPRTAGKTKSKTVTKPKPKTAAKPAKATAKGTVKSKTTKVAPIKSVKKSKSVRSPTKRKALGK